MVKNLPAMQDIPSFNSWVGKIPWGREWLLTPILLPGNFMGSLGVYSPWGRKEKDTSEQLSLTMEWFPAKNTQETLKSDFLSKARDIRMEVANHYFNYKSFVLFGFSKLGTWIHLLKFHKGKQYTGEILLIPITWMIGFL